MVQTSARLLALLSLLQVRREWTGPELADRLEVGPRTIRRDVEKLRSLGYPVEAAPGVAGGYRLSAGGELPPLLLDDAEAVAVAVGLRTAALGLDRRDRGDLDPRAGQARAGAARRGCAAGSAHSGTRPRPSGSTARGSMPTCWPALAGACRDGDRLHFAYVASDDRATPAQHRAQRGRLQRLPLVPGRLRPRPRGLAHLPDRPDPGAGPSRRPRPPPHGARRRPGGVRQAPAALRRRRRSHPHRRARSGSAFPPPRPEAGSRIATPPWRPTARQACVVSTRGPWTREFLVWMALLDAPMDVRRAARDGAGRPGGGLPADRGGLTVSP